MSSSGVSPAATTYVPFDDPRSTTVHVPSVDADELGVAARHAGVAVEGDLGVQVCGSGWSAR